MSDDLYELSNARLYLNAPDDAKALQNGGGLVRSFEEIQAMDIRRHSVDLERVQRIHLGLESEKMEFSAHTIAVLVQDIADRCSPDDAFTLHAVVNALSEKDEHFELVLKKNKRGKFVSPTDIDIKRDRNDSWLHWLAFLEKKGWPTEAAANAISKEHQVSRATFFAGVREAEKFREKNAKLFPDLAAEFPERFCNPRPNKSRKT